MADKKNVKFNYKTLEKIVLGGRNVSVFPAIDPNTAHIEENKLRMSSPRFPSNEGGWIYLHTADMGDNDFLLYLVEHGRFDKAVFYGIGILSNNQPRLETEDFSGIRYLTMQFRNIDDEYYLNRVKSVLRNIGEVEDTEQVDVYIHT